MTQISTGAVTVNWSTPTQNTNGTPLVNLAGFRIFYGTDPNNLSQSAQIANPGLTSYVLSNLALSTWYIGLSDYTGSRVQSSLLQYRKHDRPLVRFLSSECAIVGRVGALRAAAPRDRFLRRCGMAAKNRLLYRAGA